MTRRPPPACAAARRPESTWPTSSPSAAPQRTGNDTLVLVAEKAFDAGLNHILLLAAIVALAGAVLSALLVRPADFVSTH